MIGKRRWLLVLVILLALAAPCAAQGVDEALDEIAGNFTVWDWLVIVVYLIFTTVLGGLLAGKQASMKDFFLGGRRLPWPAASRIVAIGIWAGSSDRVGAFYQRAPGCKRPQITGLPSVLQMD